ncbi:WD40 repeat domain-containing protein [Herbidospora cretacea]|uniref:WD40 repeat domain-containing protein n=1 Tax=Herbidospora cretacea TaxID=28444 RepID=UPI000774622A|nr:WD40 repeat domain-containing protein [Herbidospora cretacea]
MSFRRLPPILAALILAGFVPLASAGSTVVSWPRGATTCQETSPGGVPASFGAPVAMDMGGHSDVTSVAVGELDGRPVVISAGVEHTIRIWDGATLRPIGDPIPGDGPVAYGTVDGRPVILGRSHGALQRWDATTRLPVGGPLPAGRFRAVAFGELDGRAIAAAAGADGAHVFDLATGRRIGPPLGAGNFSAVALTSVHGVPLVLTGETDAVIAWDPVSGKPVGKPLALQDEFIQNINTIRTTTIGGRPVALIPTADLGVIRWDLVTREATSHSLRGRFGPSSLAVLNGRTVFVSVETVGGIPTDPYGSRLRSSIAVIDPAIGERVSSFEIPGHVTSLAVGDLGGRPVIVTGGRDNVVRAHDLATGRESAPPATGGPNGDIHGVNGELRGRPIVVAQGNGDDRFPGVWDLGSGRPLDAPVRLPGGITSFATGDYGGRAVLAAGIGFGDFSIRLFDLASRMPIGEPLTGSDGYVNGVALTEADRRTLVVGAVDEDDTGDASSRGAVRVWDFPSGALLHDLAVRNGRAGQLALISLADRPVAVTFSATRARLWDVGAGKRMASFRIAKTEHSAPVEIASFDCTAVAIVATGRTVELYDLATGKQVERPLLGHSKQVNSIASGRVAGVPIAVTYSPQDRSIRVWDLTTSRQIATLQRPSRYLGSLSMSYLDGRAVLVGGGREALWTWDLGPAA